MGNNPKPRFTHIIPAAQYIYSAMAEQKKERPRDTWLEERPGIAPTLEEVFAAGYLLGLKTNEVLRLQMPAPGPDDETTG
jgi:hypothetical protein